VVWWPAAARNSGLRQASGEETFPSGRGRQPPLVNDNFASPLFCSQFCSFVCEATNPRVSDSNPPPMPVAKELEAARRVATLTLAELEISSSTSPPCSNLPALLRRCLRLLPLLNAGDPRLAARCCRDLLASLHAILSRDPSPSLLPAIEVPVSVPSRWSRQFLYQIFRN
jgi:hypothetical protein